MITPQDFLIALQESGIDCDRDRFSQYNIEECYSLWKFDEYMQKHFPNVRYSIASGTTKVVIIPKEEDFVIKIPFSGIEDWENQPYEYDEETDEYIYDENWEAFKLFNTYDYCEVEEKIFCDAEEEGLDFAFAATAYLGEAQTFPVYIQEKAKILNWDGKRKYSNEEISTIRETYKYDLEKLSEVWVLDFIKCYGKKLFERFLQFTIDAHINDLHNGNVGYIGSQPVLVDYSGFWE